MPNKTTEYEVMIKVTIFADGQGDAITELEKRLRPGPADRDLYAVVVRETNAKRVGAAR